MTAENVPFSGSPAVIDRRYSGNHLVYSTTQTVYKRAVSVHYRVLKMSTVGVHVDNELVERCLNGDQTAWAELIRRYQRLVYSVAYSFCPNRDDGSDIFQMVWMDLFQHLSELRHVEALPAWLITVTRRRAYSFLQAKRGTEPLDEETADSSQTLSQIETEHGLERALEQMPDRCRTLINLLYFRNDEPSYADIAKEMGMPVASIGPTRARCLEKLRKLLG